MEDLVATGLLVTLLASALFLPSVQSDMRLQVSLPAVTFSTSCTGEGLLHLHVLVNLVGS